MVITSDPNNLSPLLTINIFDSSNRSTSDLNMQGLTFGDLDQGQTSLPPYQTNQPQSRRPNKLQKMSNFISDYSDRRAHLQPTGPSNNAPLFSLISNIANSRESKKDSRKRRNNRFQRVRPSSRSSGVSSVEGAFGVTKVGKTPVRGMMERRRREDEDEDDTGQNRHDKDAEIPLVLAPLNESMILSSC
jgi:hypothetical protein